VPGLVVGQDGIGHQVAPYHCVRRPASSVRCKPGPDSCPGAGQADGHELSLSAEADARPERLTEDRLVPVTHNVAPASLLERKLNLDPEHGKRNLLGYLRGLPSARF
jgi:hypothetical protein